MPAAPLDSTRTPLRAGLTIAEALVALTVLAVGVLALLGVTARMTRDDGDASAVERATRVIADRVENVAVAKCADSSGVRVAPPYVERWRTVRLDDVTTLSDTVRYPRPGFGRVVVALEAPVRCAP